MPHPPIHFLCTAPPERLLPRKFHFLLANRKSACRPYLGQRHRHISRRPLSTNLDSPQRDGEKMLKRLGSYSIFAMILLFSAAISWAQLGNSGSIDVVVKDPAGGAVAGAKVEISFPVTGYQRQTTTGSDGSFHFANVPFNPYHLTVTAEGFASYSQDVDVRSTVPTNLQISLKVGTEVTSVTVEA